MFGLMRVSVHEKIIRMEQKKQQDLSDKIEDLELEKTEFKSEIEHLKKVIQGDRVCDGYCQYCRHNISEQNTEYFGSSFFNTGYRTKTYIKCALDCKCPDFMVADI